MTSPIDLRMGRWQDVLAAEDVDALISDAPYSPRTHDGERGLRCGADKESQYNAAGFHAARNGIDYAPLSRELVGEFVASWSPRVRWWVVLWGDAQSFDWWRAAWDAAGWMTFAPVIWRKRNPPPRFAGDGPTCSCEHMLVARPRHRLPKERSGSRPGDYDALVQMGRDGVSLGFVGAKDLVATRRVVRDYTLPGDLIADPFAGTGTTLIAAAMEGRRAIGAEMDPETFAKAQRRIAAGWTPSLPFAPTEERESPEQKPLFTGELETVGAGR